MKLLTTVTTLAVGFAASSPLTTRSVDFQWGNAKTPVKGVNIGGWLVLEPWLTPTIFNKYADDGTVDEYTLCENHGDVCPQILEAHWASWLSKSELQTIYDNGFNMIRVPVGYWAFQKLDRDAYYKGEQQAYLDQAIGWAKDIGLKVVIDLHGAPGSQNGYDNSGRSGTAGWNTHDNIQHTKEVMNMIARKYATQKTVVVGIELLNEPNPGVMDEVSSNSLGNTVQYYEDSFGDVRTISDMPVILHDAFETEGTYWNDVLSSDGDNVVIDHHNYQVFTDDLVNKNIDEHISQVCASANDYAKGVNHYVIVGEWSAALTDCAAALNGWHKGSRWEGNLDGAKATGRSCGNINFDKEWAGPEQNNQLRQNTQRYVKAQLDTYLQRTQGFFFWNFKTEQSPEWDLLRLLKWGLFPSLKNYDSSGSFCSS